jgi:hypothetical protein
MRNMIYSFFDDPSISGVIKDYVKAKQRVGEGFMSGFYMTQTRRMTCSKDRSFVGKGRELVMVCVFVSFAKIFLRLLIKGLLAAE